MIKAMKAIQLNEYRTWRRRNVTLRGMKQSGSENGVYGSLGSGLYTCALSNREMAKQYGKVYFAVNGRPKNPMKFQYLNSFEIFRQKYANVDAMKESILANGHDGIEIPGREMVNYLPNNVLYFENETKLKNYFECGVK